MPLLAALLLQPTAAAADGGFLRFYTPAERLGGELTLTEPALPDVSPLVVAEQGRQSRSDDPLIALPPSWRRPWRQVMATTPGLRWRRARLLVASWPALAAPLTVPLLLHSDGSVDVFLNASASGALAAALTALLERLERPPQGSVQPLLLELQPRPPLSWRQ